MQRGKGMRFCRRLSYTAQTKRHKYLKIIRNILEEQKHFGQTSYLKEWLVGAVFLVGFFVLTVAHPLHWKVWLIQQLLDIFRYQTGISCSVSIIKISIRKWRLCFTRYVSHSWPCFRSVVFGAIPDNGPGRRPPQRPIAVSMMLLALIATIWSTYESAAAVDWKQEKK